MSAPVGLIFDMHRVKMTWSKIIIKPAIVAWFWYWTKLTKRCPMAPYLVPSIAAVCWLLLFGHWNYAHIYSIHTMAHCFRFAVLIMQLGATNKCGLNKLNFTLETKAAEVILPSGYQWIRERPTDMVFLSPNSTDRWRFDAQNATSFSTRFLFVKHSFEWLDNFHNDCVRAQGKLRMADHCVRFSFLEILIFYAHISPSWPRTDNSSWKNE